MYLQSIKSVKHNVAKSVNRSILKQSRHLGFGVFTAHSPMAFSFCWLESSNALFPALNERAFCSRGNGFSDLHKVTVQEGAWLGRIV
jgi:hypothetical protein